MYQGLVMTVSFYFQLLLLVSSFRRKPESRRCYAFLDTGVRRYDGQFFVTRCRVRPTQHLVERRVGRTLHK